MTLGVAVELEHTTDPKIARKIALDHLVEFADYYDRLAKIEATLPKSRSEHNKPKEAIEMEKAELIETINEVLDTREQSKADEQSQKDPVEHRSDTGLLPVVEDGRGEQLDQAISQRELPFSIDGCRVPSVFSSAFPPGGLTWRVLRDGTLPVLCRRITAVSEAVGRGQNAGGPVARVTGACLCRG